MDLATTIISLILLAAIVIGFAVLAIWWITTALDKHGYRKRWYAGEKRAAARTAELGADANHCVVRKDNI